MGRAAVWDPAGEALLPGVLFPWEQCIFVGLWEIPLWQGKWAEIGLAETKLIPQ